MTRKIKIIIVTLAIGVLAVSLGRIVWSVGDGPAATGIQIALLSILDIVQSLLFGLGIAVLLFGWPWFKNLSALSLRMKILLFLSVIWLLTSWWPHVGFHIITGEDLWGIIKIDYAFHLTAIVASIVVFRAFVIVSRQIGTFV